jgi:hypothetical protein
MVKQYNSYISGEERKYNSKLPASSAKEALIKHIISICGNRYNRDSIRKDIIGIKGTEQERYYYLGYTLAEVVDVVTGKSNYYAFNVKVDNF